jgi:hypothetical protein
LAFLYRTSFSHPGDTTLCDKLDAMARIGFVSQNSAMWRVVLNTMAMVGCVSQNFAMWRVVLDRMARVKFVSPNSARWRVVIIRWPGKENEVHVCQSEF